MTKTLRRPWMPVALAAVIAAPVLMADLKPANADVRVRVGGDVRVRASGHVRVRTGDRVRVRVRGHHVRTRRPAARLRVGGSIWLGGGVYYGGTFAEPPPPPPPVHACDCHAPVPAYYGPPPPAPAPVVYAAAEPETPRFGVGLFLGGVATEHQEGDDVGLLARMRLTRRWFVEGELAKTEVEGGLRVDRRFGASLLYDFSPERRWSLHVLGGMGVSHVDMQGGDWQSEQGYAELGAGLTWRLSERLHLAGDFRAGSRSAVDEPAPAGAIMKQIAPPEDRGENYTRGRLSAILMF